MNQALNINTAIMFVVSLILAYISATFLMAQAGVSSAYNWGYIFGRAFAGVLFPLAIVYIPLLLIRRGKPKFTKGTFIAWWVLFVLFGVLALLGSMLSAAN